MPSVFGQTIDEPPDVELPDIAERCAPANRGPDRGPHRPRLQGYWLRAAVLAAAVVLAVQACSQGGSAVTIHTEVDPAIVEALDADGDGVVSRDAAQEANEQAELEAQREAEQAAREAAQQAADAAFAAVLAERSAVAASFDDTQVLIGDVRDNIVESPLSSMEDPSQPTPEEFAARLSSMVQLRLAGLALTALGFPVDLSGTDDEIGNEVQAHFEGGFEDFAQQRSLEEDPTIERLATPHCISALIADTEDAAVAAVERVRAGEPASQVADEVNPAGLLDAGGFIGCGLPLELLGAGELGLLVMAIEPGELTEPILQQSATGVDSVWVSLHLDELRTEETDLAAIGPFAVPVLTAAMAVYEVEVHEALGEWNDQALRVELPILP